MDKKQIDAEQEEYLKKKLINKAAKDIDIIKQYVIWAFWIWIITSIIAFIASGGLDTFVIKA